MKTTARALRLYHAVSGLHVREHPIRMRSDKHLIVYLPAAQGRLLSRIEIHRKSGKTLTAFDIVDDGYGFNIDVFEEVGTWDRQLCRFLKTTSIERLGFSFSLFQPTR